MGKKFTDRQEPIASTQWATGILYDLCCSACVSDYNKIWLSDGEVDVRPDAVVITFRSSAQAERAFIVLYDTVTKYWNKRIIFRGKRKISPSYEYQFERGCIDFESKNRLESKYGPIAAFNCNPRNKEPTYS